MNEKMEKKKKKQKKKKTKLPNHNIPTDLLSLNILFFLVFL